MCLLLLFIDLCPALPFQHSHFALNLVHLTVPGMPMFTIAWAMTMTLTLLSLLSVRRAQLIDTYGYGAVSKLPW